MRRTLGILPPEKLIKRAKADAKAWKRQQRIKERRKALERRKAASEGSAKVFPRCLWDISDQEIGPQKEWWKADM